MKNKVDVSDVKFLFSFQHLHSFSESAYATREPETRQCDRFCLKQDKRESSVSEEYVLGLPVTNSRSAIKWFQTVTAHTHTH